MSDYNTVEMYESNDCTGPAYVEAINDGDNYKDITSPYIDFIARSIKVAPVLKVKTAYDIGDKRQPISLIGSTNCQKIPGGRNIEDLRIYSVM